MVLDLLVVNVLHGLIAVLWVVGIAHVAAPLSPSTLARLWQVSLALPVLMLALRLLGLTPPEHLQLFRAHHLAQALRDLNPAGQTILVLLPAGSASLFVIQELWPLWRRRRGPLHAPELVDPRLDAALARLQPRLTAAGMPPSPLAVHALDTAAPVAAIQGLLAPRLVLSRGLLDRLDAEELDATVAHELAHLASGGNRTLSLVWVLRAVQATSPTALLAFRLLCEQRELACDAWATRVTGDAAALASALLKVQRQPAPDPGGRVARAREVVLQRADLAATRARVRTLLDAPIRQPAADAWVWLGTLALGGLLWTVV